jgi:hypothetical protein
LIVGEHFELSRLGAVYEVSPFLGRAFVELGVGLLHKLLDVIVEWEKGL